VATSIVWVPALLIEACSNQRCSGIDLFKWILVGHRRAGAAWINLASSWGAAVSFEKAIVFASCCASFVIAVVEPSCCTLAT
jgi:hypothetical protein